MKQLLFTATLFCITVMVDAQNVGIGTKEPLSKLHVAGDLRVDNLAKDSGVVIHNNGGVLTSLKFTGRNSDVLRGDGSFQSLNAIAESSLFWSVSGNAGIKADSNFIGTTDNAPLRFRVNNLQAGEINPNNRNTSLGQYSFQSPSQVTQGQTAVGYRALQYNAYGSFNTAVGMQALQSNTSGNYNTASGHLSLRMNSYGAYNSAFGSAALNSNTTGNANTAVGHSAMGGNLSGTENSAVGEGALLLNRTGNQNTAVGEGASRANVGSFNTAVGARSLYNNQASNQTALGYQSLYANTTGESNTSVGFQSLNLNTVGSFNSAIGYKSLFLNRSGSSNVGDGYEALYNNSTGTSNVAIGYRSLFSNFNGLSNTATGTRALFANTSGQNNTGVGYGALITNVSGFQNTALGMLADVSSPNLYNATAIGYNAKVNASNKVRIGNAMVTKIEGQVPFSTPSDGRYKFNIKEDVKGLDFILRLRPVSYQFDVSRFQTQRGDINSDGESTSAAAIRRTGFIAQEVERAAAAASYNFSGIYKPQSSDDYYSLSYESFVVPLVKAIQEQQDMIMRQQKQIENQQQLIEQLIKKTNLNHTK